MIKILLSALIISAIYQIATEQDTEYCGNMPMRKKKDEDEFEEFEDDNEFDEDDNEFDEDDNEFEIFERLSSKVKIPSLSDFEDEKPSFFSNNRKFK